VTYTLKGLIPTDLRFPTEQELQDAVSAFVKERQDSHWKKIGESSGSDTNVRPQPTLRRGSRKRYTTDDKSKPISLPTSKRVKQPRGKDSKSKESKHTPEQLSCPSCSKTYTRKKYVLTHVQTHEEPPQFKCTHSGCKRSFKTARGCQRHEVTHETDSGPSTKRSRTDLGKATDAMPHMTISLPAPVGCLTMPPRSVQHEQQLAQLKQQHEVELASERARLLSEQLESKKALLESQKALHAQHITFLEKQAEELKERAKDVTVTHWAEASQKMLPFMDKYQSRAPASDAPAPSTVKELKLWTQTEVTVFLQQSNLGKYTAKFIDDEADGEILWDVTLQDCTEHYRMHPIHARKLVRMINEIKDRA